MRNLLEYLHRRLFGDVPEVSLTDGRTCVEGFRGDMEVTFWPSPVTLASLTDAMTDCQVQRVRINPFDLPNLVPVEEFWEQGRLRGISCGWPVVIWSSPETMVEYYVSDGPDWTTGTYHPDHPPAGLAAHEKGIVAIPTGALPKD